MPWMADDGLTESSSRLFQKVSCTSSVTLYDMASRDLGNKKKAWLVLCQKISDLWSPAEQPIDRTFVYLKPCYFVHASVGLFWSWQQAAIELRNESSRERLKSSLYSLLWESAPAFITHKFRTCLLGNKHHHHQKAKNQSLQNSRKQTFDKNQSKTWRLKMEFESTHKCSFVRSIFTSVKMSCKIIDAEHCSSSRLFLTCPKKASQGSFLYIV